MSERGWRPGERETLEMFLGFSVGPRVFGGDGIRVFGVGWSFSWRMVVSEVVETIDECLRRDE